MVEDDAFADEVARPRASATVVAAVIENRAKEVGVAVYDREGSSLELEQNVELSAHSYAVLLCELQRATPGVILTVGDAGWGMGDALRRYARAHACALLQLPRRTFGARPLSTHSCAPHFHSLTFPLASPPPDDTAGAELVSRCARRGSRLAQNPRDMYLAFGAAGAVLQFLDADASALGSHASSLGAWTPACPGTVVVTCRRSDHFMTVDPATARALELVAPLGARGEPLRDPPPGSKTIGRRSLFSLLNTCVTKGGARLLKLSLLQPLRDHATIRARLDAVDELLASDDLASFLRESLRAMPDRDFDGVIARFAPPRGEKRRRDEDSNPRPTVSDVARAAARLKTLLDMRETLAIVPRVGARLHAARSPLLREIGDVFGAPFHRAFLRAVDDALEPDVVDGKSTFARRTRQAFAVRSGVDAFLDLARERFTRATEATRELLRDLRERTGAASLAIKYADPGGWRLEMTAGHLRRATRDRRANASSRPFDVRPLDVFGGEFPDDGVVRCTTRELDEINVRFRDALDESVARSAVIVDGLVRLVRDHFAALGALSSAAALADVLLAFAARARESSGTYVRPEFTVDGPLVIEDGRHPMLEDVSPGEAPFAPVSTYLSRASSFAVVTGANGAGKSTHLRQVATLVILAHAGCPVPARGFSCPEIDHVHARVAAGDSVETGASSFMAEMRETQHALAAITSKSLLLVDELGRSTSSDDGERVAWACAEAFLRSDARVLFATHAERLAGLADVYPAVRVSRLAVRVVVERGEIGDDDDARDASASAQKPKPFRSRPRARLEYTRELLDGACDAEHYGLVAAERSGFPESALAIAWDVSREVESRRAATCAGIAASTAASRGDVARRRAVAVLAERAAAVLRANPERVDERERLRRIRDLRARAAELFPQAGRHAPA